MPKNTADKVYLSAAVKRDSLLMKQLEKDSEATGHPMSHYLVQYATKYVESLSACAAPVQAAQPLQATQKAPDKPSMHKQEGPQSTSDFTDDEIYNQYLSND